MDPYSTANQLWTWLKFNETTQQVEMVPHTPWTQTALTNAFEAGRESCQIDIGNMRFHVTFSYPMKQVMESNPGISFPVCRIEFFRGRTSSPSQIVPLDSSLLASIPREPITPIRSRSRAPTNLSASNPGTPTQADSPPYKRLEGDLENDDRHYIATVNPTIHEVRAEWHDVASLPHSLNSRVAARLLDANPVPSYHASSSSEGTRPSSFPDPQKVIDYSSPSTSIADEQAADKFASFTDDDLGRSRRAVYNMYGGRESLPSVLQVLFDFADSGNRPPSPKNPFLLDYAGLRVHDSQYEDVCKYAFAKFGEEGGRKNLHVALQSFFEESMQIPAVSLSNLESKAIATPLSSAVRVTSASATHPEYPLLLHLQSVKRGVLIEQTISIENISPYQLDWSVLEKPAADFSAFFSFGVPPSSNIPSGITREWKTAGTIGPGQSINLMASITLYHSHRFSKIARIAFSPSHPSAVQPDAWPRSMPSITSLKPFVVPVSFNLESEAYQTNGADVDLDLSLGAPLSIPTTDLSPDVVMWRSIPKGETSDNPRFVGQHSYGDLLQDEYRGLRVLLKQWEIEAGHLAPSVNFHRVERESRILFGDHFIPFLGIAICGRNAFLVYKAPEISRLDVFYGQITPQEWNKTNTVLLGLQLSRALKTMHDANLIHGDVKSLNCSIDCTRGFNILRIDRYHASVKLNLNKDGKFRPVVIGSRYWVAPEMINSLVFHKPIDVFSFGLVIFELCTKQHPERSEEMAKAGEVPQLPNAFSGLTQLYTLCTQKDAAARPVFATIVEELEKLAGVKKSKIVTGSIDSARSSKQS